MGVSDLHGSRCRAAWRSSGSNHIRSSMAAGLFSHCSGQYASGSVYYHFYQKNICMASKALALDGSGCYKAGEPC